MEITIEKIIGFISEKKEQFKQFIKMSEIKLEQMKLQDGVTVIEADLFESGQPVFVVNGEDKIPIPAGDYILEDGRLLVVSQEGVIGEIKDASQEEAVSEEQEMEKETGAPAPTPTAKKTIESVVKETHFSAEDYESLKAENISLKEENERLKAEKNEKVELKTDLVPASQPITFNPESKKAEVKEVKLNHSVKNNVEQLLYK
jgi:hypothetical protein